MRIRVLLAFSATPALRAHLQESVGEVADFVGGVDDEVELAAAARGASVVVAWRLPAVVLQAAAETLRLCLCPGSDVSSILRSLEALPSVRVANSHGNAPHTAESAVALLLAAMNRIPLHDAALRSGRVHPEVGVGRSLRLGGRTVGLLGMGAVGLRVGALLRGFAVRLVGLRANPGATLRQIGDSTPPIDRVFGPDEVLDFFSAASVVIVAVPSTPATRGLVGAKELSRLGPEGVLVNVARHEVVCASALREALLEGRLGAAAVDVWPEDPRALGGRSLPGDGAALLADVPGIVLSPHRAASPFDSLTRWQDVLAAVRAFAVGERIVTEVDRRRGY